MSWFRTDRKMRSQALAPGLSLVRDDPGRDSQCCASPKLGRAGNLLPQTSSLNSVQNVPKPSSPPQLTSIGPGVGTSCSWEGYLYDVQALS